MTVVELRKKSVFIPWYEKISADDFEEYIIEELQDNCDITELEAKSLYEAWSRISIFNTECKYTEGYHSFRYYVMKKIEEFK